MPDVWTPLKLRSANEGIIFEGEASGAGGGSQPVSETLQDLTGVAVVGGGPQVALPFVKNVGTDILDLTDPSAPVALVSAMHSFSLMVDQTDGLFVVAGKSVSLAFNLNGSGVVGTITAVGSDGGSSTITAVLPLAVGDVVNLYCATDDAADHTFGITVGTVARW